MLVVLRAARSCASVLLVGLLFAVMSLPLRLVVIPLAWLFPRTRFSLVTVFMKAIVHGIVFLLTLGGARFRRRGVVPTASPVLIVANHQALLDILQVTLLSRPRVPAFVTRTRYARFVPLVSACVRLLGSPLVDPRRDPRGAVEAIRNAVRVLPHGLLIFPEGHRSTDGAMRPFRTAGLEAVFDERLLPVYLVVNEGSWRVRRLADLVFRVHLVDAWSEVLGPFEAPSDPAARPEFVSFLQHTVEARLAEWRSERPPIAEASS